jgi:acyl carrier protein
MTDSAPESAIAEFIEREIAYDREPSRIDPEELLLEGLVDSTDMLRLVFFVEERFGVHVDDEELVPENFENVRARAAFVESKLA